MPTQEQYRERRAHLVRALRSGRYRQTTRVLCRPSLDDPSDRSYCCLGVASQVAIDDGLDGLFTEVFNFGVDEDLVITFSSVEPELMSINDEQGLATLDQAVMTWYGFANKQGSFQISDTDGLEHELLTRLNDSGFSFEMIADVIEAELPGLFV